MRNIGNILSVIALIAVGILFYLHFTHTEQLKQQIVKQNSRIDTSNFRIAYFDIDSLQTHFKEFNEIVEELRTKENEKNAILSQYSAKYQRRLRELQQKATSMSQAQGEAAQQELAQMEEGFKKTEFELDQNLKKLQMDRMSNLQKKIENYLKDYNRDKGYAFIFSYQPGSLMYYKDSLYDITKEIINGLNRDYKPQKKD